MSNDTTVYLLTNTQCAIPSFAWWLSKMRHFGVWDPGDGPMTPKFELSSDFCTMQLATKFHHHMFNCSEVIMLTKTHTNNVTLLKTSTSIRYDMPVGKNRFESNQISNISSKTDWNQSSIKKTESLQHYQGTFHEKKHSYLVNVLARKHAANICNAVIWASGWPLDTSCRIQSNSDGMSVTVDTTNLPTSLVVSFGNEL